MAIRLQRRHWQLSLQRTPTYREGDTALGVPLQYRDTVHHFFSVLRLVRLRVRLGGQYRRLHDWFRTSYAYTGADQVRHVWALSFVTATRGFLTHPDEHDRWWEICRRGQDMHE